MAVFTEEQILKHVEHVKGKYKNNPKFGAQYILELVRNNGYFHSKDPSILKVMDIARKFVKKHEDLEMINQEKNNHHQHLEEEINSYYLKKALVDGIIQNGEIPHDPIETIIGVGFIDIADYSYLSKWLSPKENQVVLNGLYSAFNTVLSKYGGYLNKMEGDSMMFHYGGTIDPNTKGKSKEEAQTYIARQLFLSCIEMQKICNLFNDADSEFLSSGAESETRHILKEAFQIIHTLRENMVFASAINALFQIKIRIGANIGEVSIGNFGPEGAKQWDIIGLPVIEARRMEATAPVGGFRISDKLYNILIETGIGLDYFDEFRARAREQNGFYQDIDLPSLFQKKTVVLKDKRGATFDTYSVQVNPLLPESLVSQIQALMQMQTDGVVRIIELLKYYRGNRFVIQAFEEYFGKSGININKELLCHCIKKFEDDIDQPLCIPKEEYDPESFSLYDLFVMLGKHQDVLRRSQIELSSGEDFFDYSSFILMRQKSIDFQFIAIREKAVKSIYFYNNFFPKFWTIIKAGLLQSQHKVSEVLDA